MTFTTKNTVKSNMTKLFNIDDLQSVLITILSSKTNTCIKHDLGHFCSIFNSGSSHVFVKVKCNITELL